MAPSKKRIILFAIFILLAVSLYWLLWSNPFVAVALAGLVTLILRPHRLQTVVLRLLKFLAIIASMLWHFYVRFSAEDQQEAPDEAPENPEPIVELFCASNPEIE